MAKCRTHGEYDDDYSNGCPDCQKAQEYLEEATERAENTRKELLEKLGEFSEQQEENARKNREAIERAAYLNKNSGEYMCPACKRISLEKSALRCPECQKDVHEPESFWREIHARERAEVEKKRVEAEREQEKQKNIEKEQQEAERIAAEKHQKLLASPEYALEQKNKQLASEAFARKMERDRGRDHFIKNLPKIVGIIVAIVVVLLMWSVMTNKLRWPFFNIGLFIGYLIFPGSLFALVGGGIGGILGNLIKLIIMKRISL